jgi:hypothetical protein
VCCAASSCELSVVSGLSRTTPLERANVCTIRGALEPGAAVWYGGRSGGNNSVVECDLAKVEVAGSNPVSRSNNPASAVRAALKAPARVLFQGAVAKR